MKKFLRHNGIWVLLAALLLTAAIGIGSIFFPNLTGPAGRALGTLGTPFRAAATFVTDRISAVRDYTLRYHELEEQVAELESRIAQMDEENRQAQIALEENERLRKLLELREAHRDFVYESAMITGRSETSWSSTLTLSKGSSSGIETQMCVVTEDGYLVGVVTETGSNWSTVTAIIDPGISIGATVVRTEESAILTSDLDTMSQGLCKLDYLDAAADLETGDQVMTSGLGGVYPSGVMIGTVRETGATSSGMERYAVIAPSAHLDELKQVFVVKSFDVVE